MQVFTSSGPKETKEIGRDLVRKFGEDQLFCLFGPLAAGKTTLVKGIARELRIAEKIVSPSYVLLREYEGACRLFHLDLFRIQSSSEFLEAGLEEYLIRKEGVVAIEWAGRIEEILPEERVDVELELTDESQRRIEVASQLD
ncbi:MAG: tRNA (adenosine(37)-N6)-threonylcarbamoyltransferase complex ATPase subunit type 1 TsaE [Candidatus Bipolaricaulota bacterium]